MRRGGIWVADDESIAAAAGILRAGGVVSFPTETVYGLGANALSGEAVAKIYEAKGRPRFDPLIVHVADAQAAWKLARHVPETARRLAEAFWPGPMTLVLERKMQADGDGPVVTELLTAGLETVGLRVPGHEVARKLIVEAGVPVAAPSANRFGGISPTRAEHVLEELGGGGEKVDVILDGGPCRTGVESTVVSLVGEDAQRPRILRLGGLARERIEEVVGAVMLSKATSRPGGRGGEEEEGAAARRPLNGGFRLRGNAERAGGNNGGAGRPSPGMLARHYAPTTPLRLVGSVDEAMGLARAARDGNQRVGLLMLGMLSDDTANEYAAVQVLSRSGDLREAAANLFAAMRRLDHAGLDLIVAHRVQGEGLGLAINDRLERASAK